MSNINKLLETPEDIERAFYNAIKRADIESLMLLWSDEEEIICIHPGAPRLVGHAPIRTSWEEIFEQGGIAIRPMQLHIMQNLMTSVHSLIEEVEQAEIRQPDIHILATNIYMKTPRGWRIVSHHSSVVPGKAPLIPTAFSVLH